MDGALGRTERGLSARQGRTSSCQVTAGAALGPDKVTIRTRIRSLGSCLRDQETATETGEPASASVACVVQLLPLPCCQRTCHAGLTRQRRLMKPALPSIKVRWVFHLPSLTGSRCTQPKGARCSDSHPGEGYIRS